jgi:hypothetical protein
MARVTRFAFAAASLVLLVAWATADTVTFPQFPPSEESIPPSFVKHWIKYKVLGPQNAPFPVIVISTRRYKPLGILETLIVVSRPKYDLISKFTESLSAQCMKLPLQGPPAWYTLGIFEGDVLTPRCVMPKVVACKYLSDVTTFSGMSWTAAELKPINDLAVSMTCRGRTYSNGKPYP